MSPRHSLVLLVNHPVTRLLCNFVNYIIVWKLNCSNCLSSVTNVFFKWASSCDYGTYHIGNQRSLRRACTQYHQSLRCSHTWSMEADEGSDQKQTPSPTGWQCMHVWRMSVWRKRSAIISWDGSNGSHQANLVLITYASREGSGEPAHPGRLARTFAAHLYRQWVKRNLQTESQIPVPSEWLGMHS